MCKLIGKSNERVLCKLSKKEILRLYSIVHVAMETTKTSNFNRLLKSFISIFFPCQVSSCELQPFSCYDLANDIYLQTAKTVFSHLKTSKTVDMYNKYPSDAVHSELLIILTDRYRQTARGPTNGTEKYKTTTGPQN